jgi:3-oxoacyl-[acyl-carrier-protein] synthase III
MGSAVILHESENGESGFQAFAFRCFHQFHDAVHVVAAWNQRGRVYLLASHHEKLHEIYLDCIAESVADFLAQQELSPRDIHLLLPPQISPSFVQATGERLAFPREKTVDVAIQSGDLATSSTPVALQAVRERRLASQGDLGLIVNVGAGVQVGCALYRF